MNNKIEIFLFVKNEFDFIEKFLNHNLEVADTMTVIDNGSTDGTLEVLKRYKQSIRLIQDRSNFKHKGSICTRWMRRSKAGILVPLDTDELVVFDDGKEVHANPKAAREHLKEIEVNKNDRFQVRKIYMKHPEEEGWWEICKSNKRIMARDGFRAVDTGFHSGRMAINKKPLTCDISYLHYHFRSKDAWLKSTEQKLRARLGERWDDLDFLKTYKRASFHVGRELIRYREKGIWHSVKKQMFNKHLGNHKENVH
jgi:glycosyltransferase involved in cell wall biosynthesis